MSTITNPMHPGEFIKLAFMEPLEIGVTALAEKLGVSTSTLSRILNEKSDLSYDMAVRLSYVLGRSPESWINLQAAYSLAKAKTTVDTSHLHKVAFACACA